MRSLVGGIGIFQENVISCYFVRKTRCNKRVNFIFLSFTSLLSLLLEIALNCRRN